MQSEGSGDQCHWCPRGDSPGDGSWWSIVLLHHTQPPKTIHPAAVSVMPRGAPTMVPPVVVLVVVLSLLGASTSKWLDVMYGVVKCDAISKVVVVSGVWCIAWWL